MSCACQDRAGRFSTELFERYQRSEKALVAALAEMYVQGVSTRKVKAITEELCGHSFSASAISAINVKLDEELARFALRRLDDPYPYLIVDARYERVCEAGVIRSQAVLLAIGIGCDGGAASWRSRSPTARAARAGATSCWGYASAASQSPTTRLVRALAVEMHENWLEAHRYLNMDDLREHKKEALRMAA